MHVFRAQQASRVEPDGHFGHLEVADVVGAAQDLSWRTQLSYCPPGGGGEMHHHDKDDQLFLVVEGELTFDTGMERFTLRKHEAVLFSAGEPHATLNESPDDSLTVVVTVGR